MPTIIRIRPTVDRLMPLRWSSVTAKRRIAPAAMRKRDVPMPMTPGVPTTNTLHPMSTIASDVYDIPQEHKDFRDLVRQLAVEQVAPRAAEIDRTDEYPWDLRRLL